jgi:hypothetical protein
VIASGGASGHPAQPLILTICASDSMMTDGGSSWKFTVASRAAAAVTAIAALPARLLPKGGCAFPVSNDNVALTCLRPPRGQQGLGGPRPLLCSAGKQKLNKKGTNRRPVDVI